VNHPSRQVVVDWLKTFEKKPTLLDIPCGAGVDYENLKDIVTYCGADRTPNLIEATKALGAEVHQADIRDMPFRNGEFDIVLARAIFEHLCNFDDVKMAMEECFRVAKKWCVFSFFIPLGAQTEIRWNDYYYNNVYSKSDVESFIASLKPKLVRHEFILLGWEFNDSYDIYFVEK
jgi:ubiquinone/menaquinone biosynthesis C-methylase UbiE